MPLARLGLTERRNTWRFGRSDLMSQLSKTVARNSAVGMIAQVTIKVLSFAFTVLIIRRLGAEVYGQYAGVLAFGAIFVFFADLGVSPYAVREIARLRDQDGGHAKIEALYGNITWLRFALSLIAAALIIGTAIATQRPFDMVIGVALGTLGLMMYSFQGAAEAVLSGHERLDLAAGAKVIQQLAFVVLGAVALIVGTSYYGLIFANLVGILFLAYVCFRGVRKLAVTRSRPDPRLWWEILRFSIPFGVIGFTLGLSYKFDTVLLNIFHGDAVTGYYNSAYTLIFSIAVISNILNTSLYPSLTRQATTYPQTLPAIYERVLLYLLAIALPIAVGGSILADQLVMFLYGDGYAEAMQALRILLWVIPFMFCTEFLGYVILVMGAEKRVARAIILSTALNVALNLLLIPIYGLLAAAVMTVVTEAILLAQYGWLLRDLLHKMDWGRVFWRPFIAAAIMGIVVFFLQGIPLAANIAVGAMLYSALLLLFGVFGRAELDFLRTFRQPAG